MVVIDRFYCMYIVSLFLSHYWIIACWIYIHFLVIPQDTQHPEGFRGENLRDVKPVNENLWLLSKISLP